MYTQHFDIDESPFSIAPDPHYLYMSEGHREALAHLLYGVKGNGGFVLLTGEVGTGKTTVCRCLLEQLPEHVNIALILNPKVTALELLSSICDELHILYKKDDKSIKAAVDRISDYLLAAHAGGRKTVLIIDEAQNLAAPVLEQIRLLTNLETNKCKLLQIIMLGQPELLDKLSRPDLRQLAQRITARYHLGPLAKKEIAFYVRHRLSVAGLDTKLFSPACMKRLAKLSGGVPRLINIICDRALLGAYAQGEKTVTLSILDRAAREIFGEISHFRPRRIPARSSRWLVTALAVLVVGGVAVTAARYYGNDSQTTFRKTEGRHTGRDAVLESSVHSPGRHLSALTLPAPVADAQPQLPAPEVDEAPVGNRLAWPPDQTLAASQNLGFQNLFQAWGFNYPLADSSDACHSAELNGLRCLALSSNLEDLISTDRPALLMLYNKKHDPFYGTIIAIDHGKATILLGTDSDVVPLQEITRHWYGQYTVLWRPPPGYHRPLQLGYTGPAVKWLAETLASVQDFHLSLQEEPVFDNSLLLRVRKFQVEASLTPDGIAGPRTLMKLNTAAGLDVPTLRLGRETE